jgi:hypothetical protein
MPPRKSLLGTPKRSLPRGNESLGSRTGTGAPSGEPVPALIENWEDVEPPSPRPPPSEGGPGLQGSRVSSPTGRMQAGSGRRPGYALAAPFVISGRTIRPEVSILELVCLFAYVSSSITLTRFREERKLTTRLTLASRWPSESQRCESAY